MAPASARRPYADWLPELYREGDKPGRPSEARRLVDIVAPLFEELNEQIDRIATRFDPFRTDPEFLPWLASWVALVLRAEWEEAKQRQVLAQIIALYKKRGTKEGLEEYLSIYAGSGVTIQDGAAPVQIGVSATIGRDTVIGGAPPYTFIVNIAFDTPDPALLHERAEAVRAVLDIEKPAHASYKLNFRGPKFQIGERSTIGQDTFL